MKIHLPFLPPSVNKCYYTDFKSRTRHKTADYRSFIKSCLPLMPNDKINGCVSVEYNFYVPDHKRRDVGNLEKTMSDTLVYYGIIEDDSKIMDLILRKRVEKGTSETWIEIEPFIFASSCDSVKN